MRLFVVNLRMYAETIVKYAYIRDCELKTHVQEERCIKRKANRQAKTNFTPIKHYQENMPLDSTQKQERKSNSNTLNAEKKNPKGQLLGNPQRSHQFCYGEKFLWLGVPQQTARLQKSIFPNMQ